MGSMIAGLARRAGYRQTTLSTVPGLRGVADEGGVAMVLASVYGARGLSLLLPAVFTALSAVKQGAVSRLTAQRDERGPKGVTHAHL